MAAPTFTPFPRLPMKIQDAIWREHLLQQPPNPEVCILSPPILKQPTHENCDMASTPSNSSRTCSCTINSGPIFPLTVDTAWPAIAHLSRSSRSFFFRSAESGHFKSLGIPIGLRLSPQAGNIQVPYRLFNPEVDTLYWSAYQHEFLTHIFFWQREHAAFTRQLRHVAIDLGVVFIDRPQHQTLNFPRGFQQRVAPLLETATFVLPESRAGQQYDCAKGRFPEYEGGLHLGSLDPRPLRVPGLEFVPPAGRCRLTKLSDEMNMKIKLDQLPPETLKVARRMGFFREKVSPDGPEGHHVSRRWLTVEEYMVAELRRTVQGTRLDVRMAVFEERQITSGVGGNGHSVKWVEVCGERRVARAGLESEMSHALPWERKDPEKYRVLDDDVGRFGKQDHEPELQDSGAPTEEG